MKIKKYTLIYNKISMNRLAMDHYLHKLYQLEEVVSITKNNWILN